MDYLDPKKRMQHTIVLFTGYILIGIAIIIATIVLLHQAYGFGLGKNGNVIQNGLLFFSSQPNPADIYIDGKRDKARTNTRLVLPENVYDIELRREGYHDWKRTISVEGGRIFNFDYPLLIPEKLESSTIASYASAPAFATQSPDRRWIVVAKAGSLTDYDVYDTQDIEKEPVTITLPETLLTAPTLAESPRTIAVSEWSANNRHFIIEHRFDDKLEYILVDREDPLASLNLTATIPAAFNELTLIDRKFDLYFLLAADGTLTKFKLGDAETTPYLENVLAYRSYSDDTVLYATSESEDTTKVSVRLQSDDETYPIRSLPLGAKYLLDFTRYDDVPYAVVGVGSDERIYIYKDPIKQLRALNQTVPAPMQVLRLPGANFASFSSNTQYIMVENASSFAVYDLRNENGYNYKLDRPLDAPQTHASWMDGHRINYVSNGKHFIVEYDSENPHELSAASPNYLPFYSRDYDGAFTLAPGENGAFDMLLTPFLIPEDQ